MVNTLRWLIHNTATLIPNMPGPRVLDNEILVFDGACGTSLQELSIPESAWEGKEGCNELLNVTAPDAIIETHASFFEAGAMIVETNTFGASRTVLTEYGLELDVERINTAAVENARQAAQGEPNRFVAGSMGPGTKLPSLGHIPHEDLFFAYREQCTALVKAGVDVLLLETCQDLWQVKLAMIACLEVMEECDAEVPLMVSITVEQTGTMLVGTDISAATATIEPYPVVSLGLNCATGPTDMVSRIQYLSHNWPRRISCIPNQGLPEVVDGRTRYPLEPDEFAQHMKKFVVDFGVSIVGGCCGSTPDHIRALTAELDGVKPGERELAT
jgi:methionine synthase I (cobalamin-dependent)